MNTKGDTMSYFVLHKKKYSPIVVDHIPTPGIKEFKNQKEFKEGLRELYENGEIIKIIKGKEIKFNYSIKVEDHE